MKLWRRGKQGGASPDGGGRHRRARRVALFGAPIVAAGVIALAASGVTSTFAEFSAAITNSNNGARTATPGLEETGPGPEGQETCTAVSGQWTPCGINKFGNATLAFPGTTTKQVNLHNTGDTAANLFLLPSACSDSEQGANGPLCGLVSIRVQCGTGPVVEEATLIDFFNNRNPTPGVVPPTGYSMGTIGADASVTCTVTLTTTGTIPAGTSGEPLTISQPLSWRLVVA